MKTKQRGFTLLELILCIWIPFVLVVAGFGIYVIWHFISKFW